MRKHKEKNVYYLGDKGAPPEALALSLSISFFFREDWSTWILVYRIADAILWRFSFLPLRFRP
jgi:hypothetical protein